MVTFGNILSVLGRGTGVYIHQGKKVLVAQ